MTLAQWLGRTDAADEALAAARRAVEIAPDDAATHTTLAEQVARGRGRAREGHRAEPRRGGALPHACAIRGRAEGVRSRTRRAPPPDREVSPALAGAFPARASRHRDRVVGRGDRRTPEGR